MPIWHDAKITDEALFKRLVVPFDDANVNPGSIDLCLNHAFRRQHPYWIKWGKRPFSTRLIHRIKKVEPDWSQPVWGELERADEWIVAGPGEVILACTEEWINVPDYARGILFLKSSLGREGWEHLHAGLFDAGFRGQGTLELQNVFHNRPNRIRVGRRCVQMEFADLTQAAERPYHKTGRYGGQIGPTASRA